MKHKIHLSVRAENDLLDIWQYTFAHWDETQADKYLDELDQSIQLLADNPEMGSSCSYLRKGYRVIFINRHAGDVYANPSTHSAEKYLSCPGCDLSVRSRPLA